MFEKIAQSSKFINSKSNIKPKIGLILGSGLGDLANDIEDPVTIKYSEIPNFPVSTVAGHAGQLVIGKLEGKEVIAMQGRFHYYEGYSQKEATFPVRVMKELGVEILIVTNAAGGVNKEFKAGDLMLIRDHINFSGSNPLVGKNDDRFGARFPDMSDAYSSKYVDVVKNCAKECNIDVKEGVYMFFSGPNYETPAEVRMAQILGADAVGMSTVPEVIVASHSNIGVIGISCITNMAAGILNQPLSHEEVIETTQKVKSEFMNLVKTRDDLEREAPRLKKEWIQKIDSIDDANRKYVLVFDDLVFEADHEQDITSRLIRDYIETDDRNMQLLFRIDFARALSMYSIMNGINVEVYNNGKKVRDNYAVSEDDPDYEKDYEIPDVILDVFDEFTLFKGLNELKYAKIYYKSDDGEYKLF